MCDFAIKKCKKIDLCDDLVCILLLCCWFGVQENRSMGIEPLHKLLTQFGEAFDWHSLGCQNIEVRESEPLHKLLTQFGEAFDWRRLKIRKIPTVAEATVGIFGTPNGNRTHN